MTPETPLSLSVETLLALDDETLLNDILKRDPDGNESETALLIKQLLNELYNDPSPEIAQARQMLMEATINQKELPEETNQQLKTHPDERIRAIWKFRTALRTNSEPWHYIPQTITTLDELIQVTSDGDAAYGFREINDEGNLHFPEITAWIHNRPLPTFSKELLLGISERTPRETEWHNSIHKSPEMYLITLIRSLGLLPEEVALAIIQRDDCWSDALATEEPKIDILVAAIEQNPRLQLLLTARRGNPQARKTIRENPEQFPRHFQSWLEEWIVAETDVDL